MLSSLSILSLSCLLFFLAKEEYKVRYDEKEREAKDLNEKVTVSSFRYTKEVSYVRSSCCRTFSGIMLFFKKKIEVSSVRQASIGNSNN